MKSTKTRNSGLDNFGFFFRIWFFFFFFKYFGGNALVWCPDPLDVLNRRKFLQALVSEGGNDGFGFILVLRHLALQVAFAGNLMASLTEEGTCTFKFIALTRFVT